MALTDQVTLLSQRVAAEIKAFRSLFNTRVSAITSTRGVRIGFNVVPDPANPTRLTDDLNELVNTGADWVRLGIQSYDMGGYFGTVGAGGQWFWTDANVTFFQNAIIAAKKSGLRVSITLAQMANNDAWTFAEYLTVNNAYWNKIASMCAAAGGVDVIQVYNEHDSAHFRNQASFNGVLPTAGYLADLTTALQAARTQIKALLPYTLVTTSCTGYPVNDATEARWNLFYDGVHSALDLIGLNVYPGNAPGDIQVMGARFNRLEARYSKKVIVQEIGIPTETGGAVTVTQANNVLPMMINASASSSSVLATLIYQLRNTGTNATAAEQNFGILTNGGARRGTYDAVVNAIAMDHRSSITKYAIGTGTPTAGTYVDGGTGAWTTLPAAGSSNIVVNPTSVAGLPENTIIARTT